jgi:hypothetical protein
MYVGFIVYCKVCRQNVLVEVAVDNKAIYRIISKADYYTNQIKNIQNVGY